MGVSGVPEAVTALSTLIAKVFGFVVGSKDLAGMKRESVLEDIHVAFKIALDNGDDDAADLLLQQLRELRRKIGH